MSDQVLYFPYMSVPRSAWLTQVLLYWDQLGSIVPYEYVDQPEALGPYMQQLLLEELVVQVQPGAHLHSLPRFAEAFTHYIEQLGPELDVRRRAFAAGRGDKIHSEKLGKDQPIARVHIEKLDQVSYALEQAGLARVAEYPWFDVELETADDFMCYLATCLGQLKEVGALPITDTSSALDRLVSAGIAKPDLDAQAQPLRVQVLETILPVPLDSIEPAAIRRFKDKHREALGHFRRRVEEELNRLADMQDDSRRERAIAQFIDRARAETQEILSWMREARWKGGVANVGGILSALPNANPVLGLLNAIREALFGGAPLPPPRDFAYAAHLQATAAG